MRLAMYANDNGNPNALRWQPCLCVCACDFNYCERHSTEGTSAAAATSTL